MTTQDAVGRHEPDGLLGALARWDVLVQPEVALTRGIWWILGLDGAATALDPLVRAAGLEPGAGVRWSTEVVGPDLGRTDLEASWGTGQQAHVVVEAKLGHDLTVGQISAYRSRLPDDAGLLVALVPERRREEANRIVDEYRAAFPDDRARLAVWTYDDVLDALETHLPGSGDVAQLRGLLRTHRALDIAPFTEADLWDEGDGDARMDDAWRVVGGASFGLNDQRLPEGQDVSMRVRRYVSLAPHAGSFAVGVGRTSADRPGRQPWAWLRAHHHDAYGRVIGAALAAAAGRDAETDADYTWVPLEIPVGQPGALMIPAVQSELERFLAAAREAVANHAPPWERDAPTQLQMVLPAVAGIAPIAPEDQLDSSDARARDIEIIAEQLIRSVSEGRMPPRLGRDTEYQWVRYIGVPPLRTYVSVVYGRRAGGEPREPFPWASIRVHRSTPDVEVAWRVLEDFAPGEVRHDPNGRSIPLRLPVGMDGPELLRAAREQFEELRQRIRAR